MTSWWVKIFRPVWVEIHPHPLSCCARSAVQQHAWEGEREVMFTAALGEYQRNPEPHTSCAQTARKKHRASD